MVCLVVQTDIMKYDKKSVYKAYALFLYELGKGIRLGKRCLKTAVRGLKRDVLAWHGQYVRGSARRIWLSLHIEERIRCALFIVFGSLISTKAHMFVEALCKRILLVDGHFTDMMMLDAVEEKHLA